MNTTADLDIQIISSEDELEQSALVYLQEVSVPGGDIIRSLLFVLIILQERSVKKFIKFKKKNQTSGRGGSSLW